MKFITKYCNNYLINNLVILYFNENINFKNYQTLK